MKMKNLVRKKIMKRLQQYILLGLVAASLVGCSDDKDETGGAGRKVEVSFTTEVQTRALTNVLTTLEDNAEMTVYLAGENAISLGNKVDNVKVTCRNHLWKGTPAIEMESGESVYLYAAYPYQPTADMPAAIPVEIESQTDYLYSGSGVIATYEKPAVTLTMKHALSILAFNIRKDNYPGEGKLQQITIDGTPVYTSGTLNVASGSIKGISSGKYTQTCDRDIQPEGWEENLPDFFCIPFSSSGTDVKLTFKIDGEDYPCQLPKYTIAGGMKYIFSLSLTEQGLRIFPEQTKQISLNVDADSMSIPGYNLLKIVHNSSFFALPSLKGNSLVGSILWGDGQKEEYNLSLKHFYESDSEESHTVTVETWGAGEVSFPDLVGISEIDLSAF